MKKGRVFLLLTIVTLFAFVFALCVGSTTNLYVIAQCALSLLERHAGADYVVYIGLGSLQLIPLFTNLVASLISPILLIVSFILLLIANKKEKSAIPSYITVGISTLLVLGSFALTNLCIMGYTVISYAHQTFFMGYGYTFKYLFNSLTTFPVIRPIMTLLICAILLVYGLIPLIFFLLSLIFGIVQKAKDKKAFKEAEEEPQEEQPEEELIERPQE